MGTLYLQSASESSNLATDQSLGGRKLPICFQFGAHFNCATTIEEMTFLLLILLNIGGQLSVDGQLEEH